TVWIQVPSARARDIRDRGPIWQGQLPITSGWMDLLQTNVVLEDVVRRHRLYLTPRQPGDTDALATFGIKPHVRPALYRLVVDSIGKTFTLSDKKHLVQLHGTVGDSIGAELGFAWVPPSGTLTPGRLVEFTVVAPYEAAKLLAKRLKTSADADGNFLRLGLGGSHPRAAPGLRAGSGRARHHRRRPEVDRAEPGVARSHREAGRAARPAYPLRRRQPGGATRRGRGGGARTPGDPGPRHEPHARD